MLHYLQRWRDEYLFLIKKERFAKENIVHREDNQRIPMEEFNAYERLATVNRVPSTEATSSVPFLSSQSSRGMTWKNSENDGDQCIVG